MKAPKAAWVAVVAVTTLSLGACAQANTAGNEKVDYSASSKLDAAKVTVMGFANPDEVGKTRWDLAAKAIQPATISSNNASFDIQSFLSANSAGNPPDLVYIDRGITGTLASLGAITPLDDCISGDDIKKSDFNQSALAQVTFDGHIYGIPEFNQVQITQANGDLLAAQGLTINDVNGSDWTKLKEAAVKLNKTDAKGKLVTIGYDPKIPEFFPLWVKANGADLISADGKKANLNDPRAVEALEYAKGILDSEGGWPAVKSLRDSADMFGADNQYAKDQLGAMNMEQWYIAQLDVLSPNLNLATSPFISKTTGKPIAMATGSAWAIPTKAKNKAAACRFVKTMTQTSSWIAAAKARVANYAKTNTPFTGLLTANDTADKEIRKEFVKDTGSPVWNQAIDAMYTANDNLFYMPAIPDDQEFKQTWTDAVNRVLSGQMSAKESLDKAQAEAQKDLDAAWAKFGAKD